jgi:hypothetical protein
MPHIVPSVPASAEQAEISGARLLNTPFDTAAAAGRYKSNFEKARSFYK